MRRYLSDPLELELLQSVVDLPVWALGTKLQSSRRVASTPNC